MQAHIAESLLDDLPPFPNGPKILEIGCGTGVMTKRLVNKYPKSLITASDISPEMIERARSALKKSDNIKWRIMDAEEAIEHEKYDLIVANMVCHWFKNPREGMVSLRRNLNNNGRLYFSIPAPDNFQEWRTVLNILKIPLATPAFTIPQGVKRSEEYTVPIESALKFFKAVKATGSHTPSHGYRPMSPGILREALRKFENQGFKSMTWKILYGWLPPVKNDE